MAQLEQLDPVERELLETLAALDLLSPEQASPCLRRAGGEAGALWECLAAEGLIDRAQAETLEWATRGVISTQAARVTLANRARRARRERNRKANPTTLYVSTPELVSIEIGTDLDQPEPELAPAEAPASESASHGDAGGERLGEFRLGRMIRSEPFGKSYEATGPDASKRARAFVFEPEISERGAVREALALAEKLRQHPEHGTARILGTGTENGRAWIIEEALPGISMERFLARTGPLPESRAYMIIRAIAGIVRRLGEQGLCPATLRAEQIVLTADRHLLVRTAAWIGPVEREMGGECDLARSVGYLLLGLLCGAGQSEGAHPTESPKLTRWNLSEETKRLIRRLAGVRPGELGLDELNEIARTRLSQSSVDFICERIELWKSVKQSMSRPS